jgi:hypothetical protein
MCRADHQATGTVKEVESARSTNGTSRRSFAKDHARHGTNQEDFLWLQMFNAAHGSPSHSRNSSAAISTQALLQSRVLSEHQQSEALSAEQFATTFELLDSFASSRGYPVDESSAQKLLTARADAPPWHVARAVYLYWHQKRARITNDCSPPCNENGSVFRDPSSLSAGTSHNAPAWWRPQISSADLCSGLNKGGLVEFDRVSDVQAMAADMQHQSAQGESLERPDFLMPP